MFAMLMGAWPRATLDGSRLDALEAAVVAGRASAVDLERAVERVLDEAIGAQVAAGMGLVTDGSVRWADAAGAVLGALRGGDTGGDGLLVRAWRAAAARCDVPVAQAVPGPWSLAVRDAGRVGGADDPARSADEVVLRAGEIADALAGELEALAAAGCPVVRIDEPAAVEIGTDERRREGFLGAHRRLLGRAGDLHAMLAIMGGSAAEAGAEAIVGAPYASFLFDLIAGPDNWTLVRAMPGDRGIVCAALRAGDGRERLDQAPELAWAAHYAASAHARGLVRVGLANATPLDGLTPAEAVAALEALGRSAALAALPPDQAVRAGMDPRTITQRPGGLPPGPRRPKRQA